jgi:hypothetical protein
MDLHNEFTNSRFFHAARIDRRSADALVGIAAGLIAYGVVNTTEAIFLKQWLESQVAHLDDPVINLLYSRLACMLQDNVLDEDESHELLNLLHGFAGLPISHSSPSQRSAVVPNDLPFNTPEPDLIWADRVFVFTGVMAYGPRKNCQALI